MIGSDPEQLDELASKFDLWATQVEGIHSPIRLALHHADWYGPDAEGFQERWDGPVRSRLQSSAATLRNAADVIRQNRLEQLRVSDAAGAGFGSGVTAPLAPGGTIAPPADGGASDVAHDVIADFLEKLGIIGDAKDLLMKSLRALDPSVLKSLGKFLAANGAVLDLFKGLGKMMDIGPPLLDFITDWVKHPSLPIDERLFHAAVFMGIGIGQGAAFKWIAGRVGLAVGSTMAPPLGTVVGGVAGFTTGLTLSEVMKAADGAWNVNERAADFLLEGYQNGKEEALKLAEKAGEVVQDVADGAKAVGGAVVDGAEAVGGAVADGAKAVGGWVNPFD